MKNYLQAIIIDRQIFSQSIFEDPLIQREEKQLLKSCEILSNGADKDDNIRPIAFAYGYQTSQANAVLMAVLMSFY